MGKVFWKWKTCGMGWDGGMKRSSFFQLGCACDGEAFFLVGFSLSLPCYQLAVRHEGETHAVLFRAVSVSLNAAAVPFGRAYLVLLARRRLLLSPPYLRITLAVALIRR